MANITFEKYREQIENALQKRSSDLGINEPVTLVDGFVNQSIQKEISGSLVIGGPVIPTIMLVGNTTGRVYIFALKILIPGID